MNKSSKQTEAKAVLNSLQAEYCHPAIREAREKQDELLIPRFQNQPLAIADIGCGTGYHGLVFAPGCRLYHGYEISEDIGQIAQQQWRDAGLENAQLFLGDVAAATLPENFYDLVLCMYFTPGNFRDFSEDLSIYTDTYLDKNPAFIQIFSRFYQALKPGGHLFLTIYKDVPEAEAAQIDFYEKTNQHVVTPRGSRFVATAEHFWSVRWTRESLFSNLLACNIKATDILLTDLNTIAWLVEVHK